jgi:hypothetical protein
MSGDSPTDRDVLQHRLATLSSLLATPKGPLGGKHNAVAQRMLLDWEVEKRLLERILAESQVGDVRATVEAWATRTRAYAGSAPDGERSWTDRSGVRWDAQQVLDILDETRERLEISSVDAGAPGPCKR